MYGPTHLPNPRAPPLFSTPIPTCSQPETRPPLPLSFFSEIGGSTSASLVVERWVEAVRLGGGALQAGRRTRARGAPRLSASPRARWPVCGLPLASSSLPRSAPPRHADAATLDAPRSSCRHQFYLFSVTHHDSSITSIFPLVHTRFILV
jgi:hypothetical protein